MAKDSSNDLVEMDLHPRVAKLGFFFLLTHVPTVRLGLIVAWLGEWDEVGSGNGTSWRELSGTRERLTPARSGGTGSVDGEHFVESAIVTVSNRGR